MRHVVVTLTVALLTPLIARCGAGNDVLWIEAEQHVEQRGAHAAQFAMSTASGGACVDNDWGGREGDVLRYKSELPVAFRSLYVTLRYARQTAGESRVRVMLDEDADRSAIAALPATGDWGFRPDGWKCATVPLPGCAKGSHTLEIRSLADRNNVNFDWLLVRGDRAPTAARPWRLRRCVGGRRNGLSDTRTASASRPEIDTGTVTRANA